MSSWKPVKISFDITEPTNGSDDSLPPIILLHGATQCRLNWNKIDQPLADATRRKVYKLDARNHGDSEWTDDFSFEILGKDLNHFMEQNKIPKAILIGHSMGGRTAMEVAGRHPNKVEKLIVEDISSESIDPEVLKLMSGFMEIYEACLSTIPKDKDIPTAAAMLKEFILTNIPEGHATEKTREVLDFSHNIKKTDDGFKLSANIKVIRTKFEEMIGAFEGSYDGDSLFVYGTKSHLNVIKDKDAISKKFPKAVFKAVENATHIVHGEYPEEFLKIVLDFIKEC